MSEIRAIQTVYNGYKFRSRLEARWAVFFDKMGIKYQYEPEGFQADNGAMYLPDFFFPDLDVWVEVKGNPHAFDKKPENVLSVLTSDASLSGFLKSAGTQRGLLLLGDIPNLQINQLCLHPIIQRGGRYLFREWCTFGYLGFSVLSFDETNIVSFVTGIPISPFCDPLVDRQAWDTNPIIIPVNETNEKLVGAYACARQARFEHGERGGR